MCICAYSIDNCLFHAAMGEYIAGDRIGGYLGWQVTFDGCNIMLRNFEINLTYKRFMVRNPMSVII